MTDRRSRATLDLTFAAILQTSDAPGGWTYVMTDWTAEFFGTRGLVKVAGTVEGHRSRRGPMGPRSWLGTAATVGSQLLAL